jgi:arylsulfatase
MNIIFLVIDALRTDRLGCYGYKKRTSPFIDSLAANGVVFENHFTPVVPTQPAFTSIFSGTHPLTHRVFAHEGFNTPNPIITWLPLLMRHHKVSTVAVDNLVDHRQWFARGFEYYVNPRMRGEFPPADVFNERAIEWLTKTRREPFFMSLHYWDTHTPYAAPDKYLPMFYEGDPTTKNVGSLEGFYKSPQVERWPETWFADLLKRWPGDKTGARIEDAGFLSAMYDSEVRCADDAVKALCDTLKEQGLFDDTLLVICADHGEELCGEHDIWFDHHGLYDSNLRCPMIFHWPKGLGGSAGRRVTAMSQHQDLLPTFTDAMGVSAPMDVVEGRSMLPLARGTATLSHWNHLLIAMEATWQAKWTMRTPEYKLIVSRQADIHNKSPIEVYDLLEDPKENLNLAYDNLSLTRTLLDRFDDVLRKMLETRGYQEDPVAVGGITLGRRFLERTRQPYPPAWPKGFRPHPPPKLKAAAPPAAAKAPAPPAKNPQPPRPPQQAKPPQAPATGTPASSPVPAAPKTAPPPAPAAPAPAAPPAK